MNNLNMVSVFVHLLKRGFTYDIGLTFMVKISQTEVSSTFYDLHGAAFASLLPLKFGRDIF